MAVGSTIADVLILAEGAAISGALLVSFELQDGVGLVDSPDDALPFKAAPSDFCFLLKA